MANEITPTGTPRLLRTPPSKSVIEKPKKVPVQQKKNKSGKEKQSDDGGQIHIDEYI